MAAPRLARRIALAAAAAAVLAALGLALRPSPLEVEVAPVVRGDVRVVVEGPGKTRVREGYTVAAPVAAVLERLALHEGDTVVAGAEVAVLRPLASTPLDARTAAEARARLAAARAGEAEARAAVERARVGVERADADLERARALAGGGAAPKSTLEDADAARRARAEELRMVEAAVRRAAGEAEAARALLASTAARGGERVALRAPVAGKVLRVHRESEGPVPAGAPILDVGDPDDLEAVVELLTTQAVRVAPGARAEIVRWGGEGSLAGRVARIEPAAFTKVSALGVEEQRVEVVVAPEGPGWQRLGDGFSLDALITVAEARGVQTVAASALVRAGQGWAVFVVADGRASLRPVELGATSADVAEVRSGLADGERVALRPGDRLAEGARVRAIGGGDSSVRESHPR